MKDRAGLYKKAIMEGDREEAIFQKQMRRLELCQVIAGRAGTLTPKQNAEVELRLEDEGFKISEESGVSL